MLRRSLPPSLLKAGGPPCLSPPPSVPPRRLGLYATDVDGERQGSRGWYSIAPSRARPAVTTQAA